MLLVHDKINCSGCMACESVCPKSCIHLARDEEGFYYPKTDIANCEDCHLCEQVCPILYHLSQEDYSQKISPEETKEAYTHRICTSTKKLPRFYASINLDKKIRLDSTSGGVFSALAEYVYDRGGWVYGVVVTNDYNIRHVGSNKREDLNQFRGSKYVQSFQGDVYKQILSQLQDNCWVLYSGTPCQVEGLKRYVGKDYERLITVDLFCHGVGSPKYWEKYITYMQEKYKSYISSIKFREKTYGYNSACMAVYFSNGLSSHKGHDDDLYWTAFSKCYIFRPSCYDCKFKTINHVSDFTIGDFWDTNGLPEDFASADGCTLLILQSEKASMLLPELFNKIVVKELDAENALLINGGPMPSKLITSSPYPEKRLSLFKDIDRMKLDELVNKYIPISAKQMIKCKLKPILYKFGILDKLKGK